MGRMRGELYRDQQSSVSPSWLINGRSRYAIRTITQLDYHSIRMPKAPARLMLLVGAVLSVASLRFIVIGAQPAVIPFIMLAGSLILVTGSACALRLARSQFRVDVTLQDGVRISLMRTRQAQADNLLEALSDAVDCQQSSVGELPSVSSPTSLSSHPLRQSVAQPDEAPFGAAPIDEAPIDEAPTGAAQSSLRTPARNISPVIATEPQRLRDRVVRLSGLLATLRRRGRPADSA
ncbi:hypothetical protein [Granulosicoccus antarcticus]|uniref:Uncharacterized protein n=1 Tax=Granulosicoccus antarcticus IMCC3135 TaxID=1192854 RepID=A0A2Z2NZD1_9GAMM|nr:hypothetical protein [Granulosicoccus antarcticus]ASJ76643.1 hypothetical protein IMCC3135_32995 [Granulosicoccus antarcticus IMCC3135]